MKQANRVILASKPYDGKKGDKLLVLYPRNTKWKYHVELWRKGQKRISNARKFRTYMEARKCYNALFFIEEQIVKASKRALKMKWYLDTAFEMENHYGNQ
jgi:hypothetical protein